MIRRKFCASWRCGVSRSRNGIGERGQRPEARDQKPEASSSLQICKLEPTGVSRSAPSIEIWPPASGIWPRPRLNCGRRSSDCGILRTLPANHANRSESGSGPSPRNTRNTRKIPISPRGFLKCLQDHGWSPSSGLAPIRVIRGQPSAGSFEARQVSILLKSSPSQEDPKPSTPTRQSNSLMRTALLGLADLPIGLESERIDAAPAITFDGAAAKWPLFAKL